MQNEDYMLKMISDRLRAKEPEQKSKHELR